MQKPFLTSGYFELPTFKAIFIKGPDASDYLNRMSTINFKTFDKNTVYYGAFLTGKANVIAMGQFHFYEEGFCFWTEEPEVALEHIEKFHFSENFTTEIREDLKLSAVIKEASGEFMRINKNSWRDCARQNLTFHINSVEKRGEKLSSELFDYLRVFSAVPKVGVEIRPNDIVLEANFDIMIHRNKGCYPGQEVVERIYTYGSVNKKLFKVKITPFDSTKNYLSESVLSYYQSLENPQEGFGLGYFQKKFWDPSYHTIS
jgi:folate-binding protein YgfZ